MVKSFGSTLTALGLIGALAACSTPGANSARSASIFGDKVDTSNIGIATRAQAALEKGDTVAAIDLAERAVAGSPRDAGFRALLGNAYFAGGRFASAEAAYKDSLSLMANQPQLILKLALVSIAQGKSNEALAQLDAARDYLDPSDYGLALALAGQPAGAVSVLEAAVQSPCSA
jgi:D-alanyl-D-alanine carboxypeptidase